MKKLYTLSLTLLASVAFAQTPIITGIMDGDCTGGNPKVLEIYASGTVNFANYTLQNQTNAATTWGSSLSLSALGTKTNTLVYVVYGDPAVVGPIFAAEFASIPTANVLVHGTTPTTMNVNGDDRIRIINTATSVVIDQYGAEGIDGSGTAWDYIDSWAKRNNGTTANGAAFNVANWTFGGVNNTNPNTPIGSLDGLGTCQGAAAFSTVVPFGQYTLSNKDFAISGLKVYPNPVTNGKFFISTDSNVEKTVVIFDVLGKQVVNTKALETVNVSNLKSGVYIVKITEEGKTATRKLVIK